MCQEYDIYRQCYCGCVYAARIQGIDLKKVNREAKSFLENPKIEDKKTVPFLYQGKEI